VSTTTNNVLSGAIGDDISSAIRDGIAYMESSLTKQNNVQIGKKPQNNNVCIVQVVLLCAKWLKCQEKEAAPKVRWL